MPTLWLQRGPLAAIVNFSAVSEVREQRPNLRNILEGEPTGLVDSPQGLAMSEEQGTNITPQNLPAQ